MEKDKIIFLDFDGVLFDTLKEVYLINRAIYLGTSYLEDVETDTYKLYSKYKYLVYNIWMFYYYNKIIFSSKDENTIEEQFFNAIQNRNLKKEEEFCEQFLKTRRDLANNHFEYWKNLEIPYDFFFEIKKLHQKGANIAIVSKKNKNAILERFKTYDFNLDEKFVFAREILDKYKSKIKFMEEYMDKNNFKQAIFVDDNQNNLDYNNEKIFSILALWGNCPPNVKGCNQKSTLEKVASFLNLG